MAGGKVARSVVMPVGYSAVKKELRRVAKDIKKVAKLVA